MSTVFEGARGVNLDHSNLTSIGQNQYNTQNVTNITYSAEERSSALAALKPVDRSCYYVPPCSPGTRHWLIEKINKWLGDEEAMNILLLTGSPGAGKSTIASTLVSNLAELGRLGGQFFCKRDDITLSNPATIWRTIAFDLAQRNNVFAGRVIENLKAGRVDLSRADIELHFKYLIEDPLMESLKVENRRTNDVMTGEVTITPERIAMRYPVVVLDALDECGLDCSQFTQRRIFMDTITEKWSRLPPRFKLLVTSRNQGIPPAFRNVSYDITLNTGDLVSPEANEDIDNFFQHRFDYISSWCPSLPPSWPGKPIIKQLTNRAAGLFIWAETVMRFLEQGFPKEQLNLVLAGTFRMEGDAIDELYRQILQLSFQHSTSRVLDIYRRAIGAIVLSKTPLQRSSLNHFLCRREDESTIDFILTKLSSVVSTKNSEDRVHINHLSFTEFVCDPTRCPSTFFIDRSIHNQAMALACFRIMNAGLRFNICNIDTSHLRNNDLDLAPRIKNAIPHHLSYSCLYGAEHLQATNFDAKIFREVKNFVYIQLLYWLEVLSLLKEVKVASQALQFIGGWCKAHDNDALAFVADAGKFVAAFARIISQSAPHLYLSALPFALTRSKISKQFLPQFRNVIAIPTGKAADWPALLTIIAGHTSSVKSVAFSRDGRHIVSGSWDKTVCVWDTETGAIVYGPFQEHTAPVTSVAFSHDDKRVVSGSHDNTVYIWDLETGAIVSGPYQGHIQGHTQGVSSIALSQDSKYVISSSYDNSICIWDTDTGAIISGPFIGPTDWVNYVAFLQDGKHVMSSTFGEMICVWDVETETIIFQLSDEHVRMSLSIAVSQDGQLVVCGLRDHTIRIWDVDTGEIVFGPLEGHTDGVTSVAFSQDSKRIVSGSLDTTICIWDVETGTNISGPFEGHTAAVTSVAFSQDGKRVVSSSDDKTIRIWDAETEALRSFQRHTPGLLSVSFSHDGKYVLSRLFNGGFRIWDTKTGANVSNPFEGVREIIDPTALSEDGKHLVSGSYGGHLSVWDTQTGAIVSGPFKGDTSAITSVAFSQDGKCIASGSFDCNVRIWYVGQRVIVSRPFEGHTKPIASVAFSQDGKRVVSGSYDRTIRVWDVKFGATVYGSFEGHTDIVTSVAFSPDGEHVISGSYDNTIRIWDVDARATVHELHGHTSRVNSVAFSPDGKFIISSSDDKTIRIWDATAGVIASGPFYGHVVGVQSAVFSHDGKRIVSGSKDGMVRIWDAETRTPNLSAVNGPAYITFEDSSRMEDGWILGPNSELLFWVPPIHQAYLWRPSNLCVIGKNPTRLDLSRFVHGASWAQCRV